MPVLATMLVGTLARFNEPHDQSAIKNSALLKDVFVILVVCVVWLCRSALRRSQLFIYRNLQSKILNTSSASNTLELQILNLDENICFQLPLTVSHQKSA